MQTLDINWHHNWVKSSFSRILRTRNSGTFDWKPIKRYFLIWNWYCHGNQQGQEMLSFLTNERKDEGSLNVAINLTKVYSRKFSQFPQLQIKFATNFITNGECTPTHRKLLQKWSKWNCSWMMSSFVAGKHLWNCWSTI